ncbi:MAG TPA: carboxy-S-adenosyl-L-methionine synthase CmoA [Chthonomonadaceae bacterium]|nr:carboxy-S-adenosyl-L-methionine synthase CmoA [Chthonomonadaceae bacterium]
MERDDLFQRQQPLITDFAFDSDTANVFDDMVSRSVPFYQEIQRMVAEMAADFAVEGTNLYDLGCATGTTLLALDPVVSEGVRFVGIDNSEEMLAKAQRKFGEAGLRHRYELRLADLNQDFSVENASVVIMILTLQFVRPLYRSRVIRNIARGLQHQGCLIVVEKVTTADTLLNRLFIKYYYEMKRRNGYSELEIARKREALENVLIPYRMEENRELLVSEGFRDCEEFFRWYNFVGFVGVK